MMIVDWGCVLRGVALAIILYLEDPRAPVDTAFDASRRRHLVVIAQPARRTSQPRRAGQFTAQGSGGQLPTCVL